MKWKNLQMPKNVEVDDKVSTNRYGKFSIELKKWRTGHWSKIGFSLHGLDVDGQPAEHAANFVHNPGMIHASSR